MSQVIITTSSGSNGIRVTAASTWANARNHGDGNIATTSFFEASVGYECGRQFYFFDLGPTNIPDGSTITGAVYTSPTGGNYVNTVGGTAYLCSHTATDPVNSATDGQYNAIGSEKTWGNVVFSGISSTGTTDVILTDTAIAAMTVGSVFKLAIRHGNDTDNTDPTTNTDQVTWTATQATLTVTYTLPASLTGLFSHFM